MRSFVTASPPLAEYNTDADVTAQSPQLTNDPSAVKANFRKRLAQERETSLLAGGQDHSLIHISQLTIPY